LLSLAGLRGGGCDSVAALLLLTLRAIAAGAPRDHAILAA